MSNTLFIVLISLLTLCISFVSTKGTLTDLRHKRNWIKLITMRGRVAFILTIGVVLLLIWQSELNDRKSKLKDQELKFERDKKDSLISKGIRDGVDSNRKILFRDLSEALAEQDLRLDTVSKQLKNLKDSVVRTTIISSNNRPSFKLCSIFSENKNKSIFNFTYCGFDDWMKILDVTTYIVAIDSFNILQLVLKIKSPQPQSEITPTSGISRVIDLKGLDFMATKGLYIYVSGVYTDKTERNRYKIDATYYYGIHTERFANLAGQSRESMLKYLRDIGEL